MNLLKILPPSVLQYYWQDRKGVPYNPALPVRRHNSRQAWIQIGTPSNQIPSAAQVAAVALDGDGTRGILNLWTPWSVALGAPWQSISLALWKAADPIPVLYNPATPANGLAGRVGVAVNPADSPSDVAIAIEAAITNMLANQGLWAKFGKLGGAITPNVARVDLGPGTLALVSPRLWRQSRLVNMTGAFLIATHRIEYGATIVPVLNAGVRPAPWVVFGESETGFGLDRGQVSNPSAAVVPLLTAGNFAILAKSGVANIPTSAIVGDVGLSPATSAAITGLSLVLDVGGQFATSAQVTGHVLAADYSPTTPATLTAAVLAMQAAYTNAAGRLANFTETNAGLLNGQILVPGVYKWTTGVAISGDITLQGNAGEVYVFQISGNLTLASAKKIILSGGVQWQTVFWQVAGNVALGANTTFNGVILCATDITLGAGTIMTGKCLSQTAVNLASVALN